MINLQSLFASFIKANSPQANSASRLGGVARAVAVFVSLGLGIGLFIGIEPLEDSSVTIDPKQYIRTILIHEQALCLIKLYGKESAFNENAIGNTQSLDADYAYGIPQLKNPAVAFMSPIEQVNAGIEYIEHRYDSPCHAWEHWVKKGWH